MSGARKFPHNNAFIPRSKYQRMHKDESIKIRVPGDIKTMVESAAEREYKTMSSWILDCIVKELYGKGRK